MSSFVVSLGTFVFPTVAQVQDFYNEHLAGKFGKRFLRDTAHMDRDNALFFEPLAESHRRLWIIRLPTGIDTRVADHRGEELRGKHLGLGWFLQPVISGRRFGIACFTKQARADPVIRMRPDVLPGLSDESDECEFVVAPPGTKSFRADANFRAMAADLRRLRDEGLEVPVPSTPPAALKGRPPPPLTQDQQQAGRELTRVVFPDFNHAFPLFASIIALDEATTGLEANPPLGAQGSDAVEVFSSSSDTSSPTSTGTPASEGHSLLQRNVQVTRALQPCADADSIRIWQPGRPPVDITVPPGHTAAQAWTTILEEFPGACLARLVPVYPQEEGPLQCVLPPDDAKEGFTALLHRSDRDDATAVHIVITHGTRAIFTPAIPDGVLLFQNAPWQHDERRSFHGMRLTLQTHKLPLTALKRALPTPCRNRGMAGHAAESVGETTPPRHPVDALSGSRVDLVAEHSAPDTSRHDCPKTPTVQVVRLADHLPSSVPVEASCRLGICPDMIQCLLSARTLHDISFAFDRICHLHSVARESLQHVMHDGPTLQCCHHHRLYTDGSYNPADGSLAWAVIVVGFHQDGIPAAAGFISGRLGVPGQAEHYNNLADNAHAAELAALVNAMALAPQLPGTVCICYDAQSAGGIADGSMFAQQRDPLAAAIGHVHALLAGLGQDPTFAHVKAHTGDAWNECADCVAKEACRPGGFRTCTNDTLPLILQAPELAWLWMVAKPTHDLPDIDCQGSTRRAVALVPEPCWTRMPGVPTQGSPEEVDSNVAQIRLATYNTLSMRCPAQVEALDTCMHRAWITVCGFQETRVDDHARGSTAHYHVFRSSADKGTLGCQIWLHKALKADTAGHCFNPASVVIVKSSPRLLAITADLGGTRMLLVSAHAHTSAADKGTIHSWWTDLDEVMCNIPPRTVPVLLIDGNARFDRASCDPAQCQPLNYNAECMTAFMQRNALHATSFADPDGCPITSWRSPIGKPDCIDFIMVPGALSASFTSQGSIPDFGDLFGHDHSPIHAILAFQAARTVHAPTAAMDRAAMTTAEGRRKLQAIFQAAPCIPWETDVDTHLDLLNTYLLAQLQQIFPARPQTARNKSFSEQTWIAIRLRRDIRRKLFVHRRSGKMALLELVFRSWAGRRVASHAHYQRQRLTPCQNISLVLALRKQNRTVRKYVAHDQAMHCRQLMAEAQHASPERRFAVFRGILKTGRRFKQLPVQSAISSQGEVQANRDAIAQAFGTHFAKPEKGVATDIRELQRQSTCTLTLPDHYMPEGVPTLQELARNFAASAPRKAAGPSGIPPEALRGSAYAAARCHMPVVLKSFLRHRPPLLWRGGSAQAIPKANKSLNDVTGWRSILLMEIAAKGVGRCLRTQLLDLLSRHVIDMHGGSRRGMPLDIPMQAVRAHGQRLKRERSTGAVIFLDGANAFYSVLREHLYSRDALSDPRLLDDFVKATFSAEDDQMQLLAILATPGVLQSTDAPPALTAFLRHTLHASWFAMQGHPDCIFHTLSGT